MRSTQLRSAEHGDVIQYDVGGQNIFTECGVTDFRDAIRFVGQSSAACFGPGKTGKLTVVKA